jgi:hypothetical protein
MKKKMKKFWNYLKTYKKGNAYPNFRKLVFSVFLSIVLPLAVFLRLQIIFNTNFCNMFIYSFMFYL